MTAGIPTGIHVRGLDQLGTGTLLVFLVLVVAVVTITRTVHQLRRLPPATETPQAAPGSPAAGNGNRQERAATVGDALHPRRNQPGPPA